MHVYSDERITVVSPSVASDVNVTDRVAVTTAYDLDAVSGATQAIAPDAVSSATHFEERRHQVSVSAVREGDAGASTAASYTASLEPDHWAHTLGAKQTVERLERRARISLGYSFTWEGIGTVYERSLSDHAVAHQLDASWSHIATPTTVVTGLATTRMATCSDGIGCYANPYRYVIVETGGARVAVRERHPARRLSGAAAVRVSHSVREDLAVHAGYRLFRDTWRVTGHTWDAALARSFDGDRAIARIETRATIETPASFYESAYVVPLGMVPRHRSADAEVSGVRNASIGTRLTWRASWARVHLRLSHIWMRYPRFDAVPERNAWLASVGLDASL